MWDLWSGAAWRALDTCFRQGQKDLDTATAAVRQRRMTLLAERRALREKMVDGESDEQLAQTQQELSEMTALLE
eukprot:8469878-Pyramimonas_sp.AAC.1